MKKFLLEMLICPICLPDEKKLKSVILQEDGNDIIKGSLTCRHCNTVYPIQDGVARLDPATLVARETSNNKYETTPVVSSYLWSHYCDILNEENASDAYRNWAALIRPHDGLSIDAGCAVGRFVFEMSRKSDFVVGLDNSLAFIRTAREVMTRRCLSFSLKQEGRINREVNLELPEEWDCKRVEFIVGNALALPFRADAATSLSSLNLVDKVPNPMRHLMEMNRVTSNNGAQFLLSDPFSWSEEVADEQNWLGGKNSGPYAGKGLENIMALLQAGQNGFMPQWRIETQGRIWWKIRTHDNHFEQIRSCYFKANR